MRFIDGRLVIEKLTMRAVAFSRQSVAVAKKNDQL